MRGGGSAVSASIRRRRAGCLHRPPPAAPHRRSDGAPASPLRYSAPRACRTSSPAESKQAMGVAGRLRGEPAVRDGAARERGRRRSAYEAPHGSVAPRIRVQRRRIEAETVPPLPCTAVSGHAPSVTVPRSGWHASAPPSTARCGPAARDRSAGRATSWHRCSVTKWEQLFFTAAASDLQASKSPSLSRSSWRRNVFTSRCEMRRGTGSEGRPLRKRMMLESR